MSTLKRGKFSAVELTFVQAKHSTMSAEAIAGELNRSVGAVKKQIAESTRLGKLDLVKDAAPTKSTTEVFPDRPLEQNISHRLDGKSTYNPTDGFARREGITIGTQQSSERGDDFARQKRISKKNDKHITKAKP